MFLFYKKKRVHPNTYDYIKNGLRAFKAKIPKYLRTFRLGPKIKRSVYKKKCIFWGNEAKEMCHKTRIYFVLTSEGEHLNVLNILSNRRPEIKIFDSVDFVRTGVEAGKANLGQM